MVYILLSDITGLNVDNAKHFHKLLLYVIHHQCYCSWCKMTIFRLWDASKFKFELSIDMHTTLSYIAPKFNKRHIDCNKHCNISVKTLYIILVT